MPQDSFVAAQQRRSRALVLGFTVAVLVAVCTLEGFDLWWRYKEALRAGEARAGNLSFVLADYLRGSFAVADTVLRQLAVHGQRIGGPDARSPRSHAGRPHRFDQRAATPNRQAA